MQCSLSSQCPVTKILFTFYTVDFVLVIVFSFDENIL